MTVDKRSHRAGPARWIHHFNVIKRCGREILANFLMGSQRIAKLRARAGRTSTAASQESLQKYAFGIIQQNPRIQPLIKGAHVLEVGPGDHLATGLAFLACGAASYTALDRFQGGYRNAAAKQWYGLVRAKWDEHFPCEPWPQTLDAASFPDVPGVSVIASGTEDLDNLPSGAFDIVVSQRVGEHVQDIDAFARATFHLLKQGGTALHGIDFSCHGFFRETPLFFLTIPDYIWTLMGSNRGIPNRRRVHEFEHSFKQQPFVSVEIVQRTMKDYPIPPSLRDIPVESLKTERATFVLRK